MESKQFCPNTNCPVYSKIDTTNVNILSLEKTMNHYIKSNNEKVLAIDNKLDDLHDFKIAQLARQDERKKIDTKGTMYVIAGVAIVELIIKLVFKT